MINPRPRTCKMLMLVALSLGALASSAAAQYPNGTYFTIGWGEGTVQLTCASTCSGEELSAGGAILGIGKSLGRGRVELLGHFWRNRDVSSDIGTLTAGLSVYTVRNLFIRGAVGTLRASFGDASGAYEASGGPVWQVGVGYDLRFADNFALTPFVTYARKSFSEVEISQPNGLGGTTSGTASMFAFGAAFSILQ